MRSRIQDRAALPPPSCGLPQVDKPTPASMPGTGRFRSPVGAVIQRARLNPRSLTRDDVAQLQRSIGNAATGRLMSAAVPPNRTGFPDVLKANVEAMSGLAMDHVRVHYGSSKPAEVQAHAYARGSEIHLAPGREGDLPHEAWHIVQQMQGRVGATATLPGGVAVNTDAGLEREAEVEGSRAAAARLDLSGAGAHPRSSASAVPQGLASGVVQRVWKSTSDAYYEWDELVSGIRWYAHKITKNMHFIVVDEGQIQSDDKDVLIKYQGFAVQRSVWQSNKLVQDIWTRYTPPDVDALTDVVSPPASIDREDFHRRGPGGRAEALGAFRSKSGTIREMLMDRHFTGPSPKEKKDYVGVMPRLHALRTLGPRWEEIAADPSIMMRHDIFESFMKEMRTLKQNDPEFAQMNPWAGRLEFAKTLGTTSVYRAIYVDDAVAAGLATENVGERKALLPKYCLDHSDPCDCPEFLYNIEAQLTDHVEGRGLGIAQSVTGDRDIAEAVANRVRRDEISRTGSEDPNKHIYLLTLKIPKIDLFYIGDFTSQFSKFKVYTGKMGEGMPTPYSAYAESMVIGSMPGVWIQKVERIDQPDGYAETRQ